MTRAAVKGLVVFLAVILFGTFTYFCVLVYNREEEMLAARAGLVFAKNKLIKYLKLLKSLILHKHQDIELAL